MLNRLQKKWKVNGWRVLLILITFAVGGSLTGLAGRKIMMYAGIENAILYGIVYILLVTLIWPLMVLAVSVPMGQFGFFRLYIGRMISRFSRRKAVAVSEDAGGSMQVAGVAQSGNPYYPDRKGQTRRHLVLFASGAGSNAARIMEHFRDSAKARVVLVVCNKQGAGVIAKAEKEGVPVLLIDKERFFRGDGYLPLLQEYGTDLLVLAGFLWKIPKTLINAFPRRIINIHPALLPKYGGRGMYGHYVHEAVLQAGEMQSGITIHYVDEHYDNGDIIFQTACPIMEGDSPEKLASRIHQLEHYHYPLVIEEMVDQLREKPGPVAVM